MVRPLVFPDEIDVCADVIRRSFATIARIYHLTPQNAPANGAFMTSNRITELHAQGAFFLGDFEGDILTGTVLIHQAVGGVFRLDKISVLPQFRHNGIGGELYKNAEEAIIEQNGRIINIGIINENTLIKYWFKHKGFKEVEVKKFPGHPFSVCFMEKEL